MELPDEVVRRADDFLSETTVGDLMDTNIVEVLENTTVEQARKEILPGQIAVVENEIHVPVSIIPAEQRIEVSDDPNLSLIELRKGFAPALTVPYTSLKVVLQNYLWSKGAINWNVVRTGDKVVGAVSSENIAQSIMGAMGIGGQVQLSGSAYTALSSIGDELFGIPVTPSPTLRFACPKHSSPTYGYWQVAHDDAMNALCPTHKIPMNPIP